MNKQDINKEIIDESSELELALENRVRKTFEFEVMDYLGGSKKPLGKIRIRVATLKEQNEALFAAHSYIKSLSEKYKDSGASIDPDLINTIKTAFILWKVCLLPNDNKPVFLKGPQWMMENLSADEIAKMLEYYQTVLREFSPFDLNLSEEKIIAIAGACSVSADTDAPNIILSNFTTDQKAELIIRISQKLAEAQAEIKKLQHENRSTGNL